jgi:HAE1 family hydrophobic/amphiphilic exporter-1
MTAFSFVLGVMPLLVASGAGAEARKVMGMTVFSGMLVATVIGVLIIPALYVLVSGRGGGRSGAEGPIDERVQGKVGEEQQP